jgi:hypothetical protein
MMVEMTGSQRIWRGKLSDEKLLREAESDVEVNEGGDDDKSKEDQTEHCLETPPELTQSSTNSTSDEDTEIDIPLSELMRKQKMKIEIIKILTVTVKSSGIPYMKKQRQQKKVVKERGRDKVERKGLI